MSKFSINYNDLSTSIDMLDKKVYKFADVKNKLEKVAFDIFRFKDGNPDELWQVQSADDGEYIVAKYEDPSEKKEEKTAAPLNWDVLLSSSASGDMSVSYKGHTIAKIASSKMGLSPSDLPSVKRFLPHKLATDPGFVKALLSTLNEETRKEVLKLYPELLK